MRAELRALEERYGTRSERILEGVELHESEGHVESDDLMRWSSLWEHRGLTGR
jgi:hypothetical protein